MSGTFGTLDARRRTAGLRPIAELVEALSLRGGGVGLFAGCAAGDTGAALVLEVAD